MNNSKVLAIEDDRAISSLIATMLEMNGITYRCAKSGREGIMKAMSFRPDCVILDLGLPDMDGTEVIKKIRTWSNVPIIIVSARGEESDKVNGLDLGADDYITKPFSVDELMARIRASLRRAASELAKKEEPLIYKNGSLKIDYASGTVSVGETEIHLTPIEYKIIVFMSKNTGRVLTYNQITKEIWGASLPDDTPSLRVFMAGLRKKIEEDTSAPKYIQTHIKVGYRMVRVQE